MYHKTLDSVQLTPFSAIFKIAQASARFSPKSMHFEAQKM
jgi:hypothetical protein